MLIRLRRGTAVSVGRFIATSVPRWNIGAQQNTYTIAKQDAQLKADDVHSLHLERLKVMGQPWKEGGYVTFAEAEPGAAAQAAKGKVHARNLFIVFLFLVFAFRIITQHYDLSDYYANPVNYTN